jgi:hypothetical protein
MTKHNQSITQLIKELNYHGPIFIGLKGEIEEENTNESIINSLS